MWTRTRVTQIFGLELPILQGPFGGGNSTPTMAAAVSNAGGLGAIGAVTLPPEAITQVVASVRALTSKPFAINLWVPQASEAARPTSDLIARSQARYASFFAELGVSAPPLVPDPSFESQLQALLAAAPPVYSFVMGAPTRAQVDEMHRRGGKVIATATTVEEGLALEDVGVDVVVASGSDAGGHRGSWLRPVEQSLVGTMSLVPQLVDALKKVPVVAAGGIADGRGVAAAFALGAEAVQVGTTFLNSLESGAPPAHKALLGTPAARVTRLTRGFSGRHARGIVNQLMRVLDEHPEDFLAYPWQYAATKAVARAASNADQLVLWAGQAAALARPRPVAEIMKDLVEETEGTLRRLQPGVG